MTISDEVKIVEAGQSVYVPFGAKHMWKTLGSTHASYRSSDRNVFGEDDIVRYDDIYTEVKRVY